MIDAPVFIFASSWRSGSTLLQRYVTASGQVLVSGETGGALSALASAIDGWTQCTADGFKRFPSGFGCYGEKAYKTFVASPKIEHAHQWIANLSPPLSDLLSGLRVMFDSLYGERAEALGYPRYGFKETRCDLTTARQLQALFPDARFVFLVRNPFDVILSLKRRNWMGRPGSLATLHFYAMHWRTRSAQFRNADFGFVLRYEDFVSDPALRKRLMDHLGINAAPPPDFVQTSLVDWKAHNVEELTWTERFRLRYWLAGEMKDWGY